VKFGLLYEHQLPRPWTEDADYRLLKSAIEQVELADRLGFDYIWENEHHFLEEYSHSSAPEVFLAFCARNTRQIRLGHAVVLSPPAYNHPARVAERIATLDLLSDGRVEFGTGESASRVELEGFGIDPEQKKDMWAEAVEQTANMMTAVWRKLSEFTMGCLLSRIAAGHSTGSNRRASHDDSYFTQL
jgi:alkanesulfonate monooxygenase SsuD/methylene tetrahydromethanopterin reductase-like flavin-dependent oxidoreductase (luciferase family)